MNIKREKKTDKQTHLLTVQQAFLVQMLRQSEHIFPLFHDRLVVGPVRMASLGGRHQARGVIFQVRRGDAVVLHQPAQEPFQAVQDGPCPFHGGIADLASLTLQWKEKVSRKCKKKRLNPIDQSINQSDDDLVHHLVTTYNKSNSKPAFFLWSRD